MTGTKREIDYVREGVDKHPDVNKITVPDEAEILEKMYGKPDSDGIYRGEGR